MTPENRGAGRRSVDEDGAGGADGAPATGPRWTPWIAAAFAVIYSAWVLEAVIDDGVSAVWGFVSELSARTEPHGAFFAAADSLSGLLAIALSAAWRLRRPPARLASTGFAVWGGATILDSMARMPSVEVTPDRLGPLPGPARPATDGPAVAATGILGPHAGEIHALTSSAAQIGIVVTMAGLMTSIPLLRVGRGRVLAWIALATSGATIASAVLFEIAGLNVALGVWQRAGLLAAAAVVAVSGASMRGHAPDRPDPGGAPTPGRSPTAPGRRRSRPRHRTPP